MEVKDINLFVHPPFEFYYALVCTGSEDRLAETFEEENINPEEMHIKFIETFKANISKYIKQELIYFFDKERNPIMGIGEILLWGFIIDNPEISNVEELILHIENCSVEEFFTNLVSSTFYENTNKRIRESSDWDRIRKNINFMTDLMDKMEFRQKNKKTLIMEALKNAEETKQRYCLLLRQFYERTYRDLEEKIIEISLSYLDIYNDMIRKSPEKFFKDYFKKDMSVFSGNINIHLSYLWYSGSEYWASGGKTEWLSLGCKTVEHMYEEPKKERVINFLKKISDRKRIEVIELLSKKDCYVNEIADELKISAATASYHLANLQDLGIVYFERVDHRFYYHLYRERLKELFKEVMDVMIIE